MEGHWQQDSANKTDVKQMWGKSFQGGVKKGNTMLRTQVSRKWKGQRDQEDIYIQNKTGNNSSITKSGKKLKHCRNPSVT